MEQEQKLNSLSTTSNLSIQANSSLIESLYNKTHNSLEKYQHKTIHSLEDIFEIIEQTKALKEKAIEAKDIGTFAYTQSFEPPFLWDKKTPYHNPLYTSFLFERIAQHNAHLEKNNFTAPTIKQFLLHKRNIKNIAAIEKAATTRVFIDLKTIDPTNTIIIDIPSDVIDGINEVDKLMEDIMKIKEIPPHEIKTIADILYAPKENQGNK